MKIVAKRRARLSHQVVVLDGLEFGACGRHEEVVLGLMVVGHVDQPPCGGAVGSSEHREPLRHE